MVILAKPILRGLFFLLGIGVLVNCTVFNTKFLIGKRNHVATLRDQDATSLMKKSVIAESPKLPGWSAGTPEKRPKSPNLPENPENAAAAFKGVSNYYGSPPVEKTPKLPPGYPVPIDVDKEEREAWREEQVSRMYAPLLRQGYPSGADVDAASNQHWDWHHSNSMWHGMADEDAAVTDAIKGCYLPRIVVKSHLSGTTVTNEIRIFTSAVDDGTSHTFVSKHDVSAPESTVTHEFRLPSEFVLQKPISGMELTQLNAAVLNTSVLTEVGLKTTTQAPRSSGPTFNPYLPTSGQQTFNPYLPTSKPTQKSKRRLSVDVLNKAARSRNVLFDVPGGDAMAFSSYQILGPADIHQSLVSVRKKRSGEKIDAK